MPINEAIKVHSHWFDCPCGFYGAHGPNEFSRDPSEHVWHMHSYTTGGGGFKQYDTHPLPCRCPRCQRHWFMRDGEPICQKEVLSCNP